MAATTMPAAAVLLLTLATSALASKVKFNVTEMLSEFPEFSTFNNLLSQSKLADEINNRQTITVLVVDNSAAGAITSLPVETQKKVLAAQVILDYYDPVKLDSMENKTAQLTTLFQASGGATDRAGFLNYAEGSDDQMAFGYVEPGASLTSKLVKVVASRPYNISIMQVSAPIMPPSIGGHSGSSKGGTGNPSVSTPKANASSPSMAPSKKPEDASTDVGEASAPSSDDDGSASPAEDPSPAAEGPAGADSAAASSPETEKRTDATADAPTSAGSRVVAAASASFFGPMMILMVRI
jgi:uncharacterized surface protein with fasciclin (FAS1) repeats